jgi:hypothetical protein
MSGRDQLASASSTAAAIEPVAASCRPLHTQGRAKILSVAVGMQRPARVSSFLDGNMCRRDTPKAEALADERMPATRGGATDGGRLFHQ